MQTINSALDLKNLIIKLEKDQEIQGQLLKEHFYNTIETLKPVSLIKNTLKDITSSPFLFSNLIASALGLIGGFISKKSPDDKSDHPIRNIFGSILQSGFTTFIVKHPSIIKLVGGLIIQYFVSRKISKSQESDK